MRYFNVDELFILDSVKPNTKITAINYFTWHNFASSKKGYIFIDKIELIFNSIPSILFEINENDEGISLKKTTMLISKLRILKLNLILK